MQLLLRILVGFFRFWYDFIVGDAWEIAAGIAAVLIAAVLAVAHQWVPEAVLPYLLVAVVVLVVTLSVLLEFRKKARQAG